MIGKRLVLALGLVALVACGGTTGQNAASQVLKKPELPDDAEAKCSVRKSQSEPLIVEWPNASRGKLESSAKRTLVAIHYEGCELTQLACTVKPAVGNYAYWPVTRKQSRVVIKDADDLYANMPVGAVKLAGKLKTAGQLDVNMTIIGRYEAPTHTVYRGDLEGKDCEKATHIIAALTVGSFTFSAGADAEVGAEASLGNAGAGARSTAKRETLQSDGDEAACGRASEKDKGPPEGCGALLQIEVVNLTAGTRPPPPVVAPVPVPVEPTPPATTPPVAANTPPPKPAKPKCKKGERVEDGVCVKPGKKPAPKPAVVGALNPGNITPIVPTCSIGQHLEKNRCVDDPAPEPAVPPPPPKECAEGMRLEGDACVSGNTGRAQITRVNPDPEDSKPAPTSYDHKPETPPEQTNPLRTLFGYAAIGFGVGFATSGYLALLATSEANEKCNFDRKTCTPEAKSPQDQAVVYAVVADVFLGLAAASLVGYFLVPAHAKVGVAPTPNGGVATASWRFW